MTATIALVCSADRKEDIYRAIDMLDINPVKGKSVSLKANCNTADPFPASTHSDTLRTLISKLKEMGCSDITLAERSGPANTAEVLKQKGIITMSKELSFDVVNLDEVDKKSWVHFEREDSHWKNGFEIAGLFAEGECVVQTCCLKTHHFGGHFTISLKNSVGMVKRDYMDELHSSPFQRQMIAEINKAYSTDLILMDGIDVFVSGGPMRGLEVHAGIIVAGTDRIAVDAVGVAMLRSLGTTQEVEKGRVFQQDQIARAVEIGIGIKSADDIIFITSDRESEELSKRLTEIMQK